MSDFNQTEMDHNSEQHANASTVHHQQQQQHQETNIKVSNFDDFERLDGESMGDHHNRPFDVEKEIIEKDDDKKGKDFDVEISTTHVTNVAASDLINTAAAASAAAPTTTTTNLLDFDEDQMESTMQRENSPSNLDLKSSPNLHSSSTDRPLVTLASDSAAAPASHVDSYSFSYQANLPETTEVNLTPDPDDKLGLGLDEPFVNVIGVDQRVENVEKQATTGIYPGKLYAQGGYTVSPTELDEEEDEEIAEEELEDTSNELIIKGNHHLSMEPDVVPSAPDLISSPYQQQQQQDEEEFSELTREDSPPPRYELAEDQSKFSSFIDKDEQPSHYEREEDKGQQKEQKWSSVTQFEEETHHVVESETVVKQVESQQMTTLVTSKIEELIEELTPPFAACPSAAPPSKMEMAKREEISTTTTSSTSGPKCCTFNPRAWFNPDKLDPRVADLIYWRDVKKSGIGFGTGMLVLLSLTYFSLISVVAYLLLGLMCVTLSYRIYKNVLQAVQKSSEGHPFKQYLDVDLALSRDRVSEVTETFIKHLESTAKSLRRLFLVEDLVDSLKFAVVLWCFTYIGSWFNGLTLVILGFVTMFTLPKVYETYKAQIDHYLHILCSQVDDVVNKVKAKIPIGKKPKQQ